MGNFDNLAYDPLTGKISWVKRPNSRRASGSLAGSIHRSGYFKICYDGKYYLGHRLAWFMTYGKWPDGQIDHINGIRSDNRISNLRDVTPEINSQNQRRAHLKNKSGFLGATFHHKANKWRAQIQICGKVRHLGFFKTPQEAHLAYISAKRQQHSGCTI